MQVTETLSEGLKREFKVEVPASDLEARVAARLDTLKDRVQIRGFRPGKVPVAHLKKVYGRSVMAETIEAVIAEMNSKIVNDRGLKLATEPKVTLPQEQKEVEKLVGGEADLAYTLAIEILPNIELADFKNVKLERPVAEVTPAEIDEAIQNIAQQNRPFAARPEGEKIEKDDRAIISFIGRIGGAAFEGGTGHDVAVHVGSGTFIPGFEDQLIGAAAGETRTVKVTFPANYGNADLAGKDAEFEVSVKSIETPGKVTVDDEFAKSLGLESLDKLKDAVRDRLQRDHGQQTRLRVKRQLLDQLDKLHQFAPPPSLVEQEFQNIWNSVLADLKEQKRTFEDENTTEEKAKTEYREIAERRVRLGLVLAEIGETNKLNVSEEELSRAIVERARQVPGREKEMWDYYRKNPQAVANLRAPLFEEKVVDFILELATVTEKSVSKDELYKDDDDKAA